MRQRSRPLSPYAALGRLYLWLLPLKAAAGLGLLGLGAWWLFGPGSGDAAADAADRARGPALLAFGLALLLPLGVLVGLRRRRPER